MGIYSEIRREASLLTSFRTKRHDPAGVGSRCFNGWSNRPGLDQLGKPLKAAVIGPFHSIRKTTGRKLAHAKMVLQALAANSLSRTPAVAAVAPFQIGWLFTFHKISLLAAVSFIN
jgi:hypothetical protein